MDINVVHKLKDIINKTQDFEFLKSILLAKINYYIKK